MSDINYYREEALPFFEMKQCDTGAYACKKHFHEEYSLGIIGHGSSKTWCDGKSLEIEAGKLILIPPLLPHACVPNDRANWSYRMLFIQQPWMSRLLEYEGYAGAASSLLLYKPTNRQIRDFTKHLIHCFTDRRSPLETETVLFSLMDAVLSDGTAPNGVSKDLKRLEHVKEYVHEHFLERITLEELEHVSGLSRFYLVHGFKKEYHIPPHAYQNLLRINHAKKELCKLRPIAEVAVEAGFYDQSHFTKSFKHFAGVTPQKYLKST